MSSGCGLAPRPGPWAIRRHLDVGIFGDADEPLDPTRASGLGWLCLWLGTHENSICGSQRRGANEAHPSNRRPAGCWHRAPRPIARERSHMSTDYVEELLLYVSMARAHKTTSGMRHNPLTGATIMALLPDRENDDGVLIPTDTTLHDIGGRFDVSVAGRVFGSGMHVERWRAEGRLVRSSVTWIMPSGRVRPIAQDMLFRERDGELSMLPSCRLVTRSNSFVQRSSGHTRRRPGRTIASYGSVGPRFSADDEKNLCWRGKIAMGLEFIRPMFWWVEFQFSPSSPAVAVPTSSDGVHDLLATRDRPCVGRMPALTHWVREHTRMRETSRGTISSLVRSHLRCGPKTTWRGVDVTVKVASDDLDRLPDDLRESFSSRHPAAVA